MAYLAGQRARATSCRRKATEVVSKCFPPKLQASVLPLAAWQPLSRTGAGTEQ
jgi:hypothetical protein